MPLEKRSTAGLTEPSDGHRIRLAGDWWIWRTVCVRGTGFPAAMLLPLVARNVVGCAETAFSAEAAVASALQAAKAHVSSRLKAGTEQKAHYRRALHRLRQRRLPEITARDEVLGSICQKLAGALHDLERARRDFLDSWKRAESGAAVYLQRIAGDDRFREAVAWQNLELLERVLDPMCRLATPLDAGHGSTRKMMRLVARYLSRYCMRNETIGFFGPVGWSEFHDHDVALTQQMGERLIKRHQVHLEYWAARAIAAALMRDPRLKSYLVPRRFPGAVLEEQTAVGTFGQRLRLSPRVALAFAGCDGSTPARLLVQRLLAEHPQQFASYVDAVDALDEAEHAGLIIWEPELPLLDAPEQHVRSMLNRIEDPAERDAPAAEWRRFEAAFTDLRNSFGKVDRVAGSLHALNQAFEQLTGLASVRDHGKAYAGRTLAFLDCERDHRLTLGSGLRERLAPPLSLVLDSVRWFTIRLAGQFSEFIEGVYEAVRRRLGGNAVPLGMLWTEVQQRESIARAVVDDVLEQLHEAWSGLLGWSDGATAVRRSSAELRANADILFDAPGPGWPGARHHSPDLMIAARSTQELCEGGGYFVLGEIHVGLITVTQQNFLEFHPDPAALLRAAARDRPEPEIEPMRSMTKGGQRVGANGDSGINFHIEYDDTPSWLPRDRVLPIADVMVETSANGLVLRARDGRVSFPAISFFGSQTLGLFKQRFGLFADAVHRPRVTIDDLVVSRETWRFSREALSFTAITQAYERYLTARAFMREHALPRHMFYRVPGEPKPIYLDWDSPTAVDLFAHSVRGSNAGEHWQAALAEMLPGPDELWLEDSGGARYTSELRLTVVDGRGAQWSE